MSVTDSTILIFKAITSFIKDMSEIYGDKNKPLLLYASLLEKTGIMHSEPIKKHISIFQQFVMENEDAILGMKEELFKEKVIRYSEKVYLDIGEIFEMSKDVDRQSIWRHLLTLCALLNPSSQAKEILRREKEQKKEHAEEDFLSGLIDKVGKHIDPTSTNPMESMNNLVSSGVFGELMTNMDQGMTDGTLDMQKMVGSLQKMIGSLSTMMENPPK